MTKLMGHDLNIVHTGDSLKTKGIWKKMGSKSHLSESAIPVADGDRFNSEVAQSKNDFSDLLELARLSGKTSHTKDRGGCRKCGNFGHMTHNCRNFLMKNEVESDSEDSDADLAFEAKIGADDREREIQKKLRKEARKEKRRKKKKKKEKKERKKERKRKRKRKREKHKSSKRRKRSNSYSSSDSDSAVSERKSTKKKRKMKNKSSPRSSDSSDSYSD